MDTQVEPGFYHTLIEFSISAFASWLNFCLDLISSPFESNSILSSYHHQLLLHSAHRFWASTSKGHQRWSCHASVMELCATIPFHESPSNSRHRSQHLVVFKALRTFHRWFLFKSRDSGESVPCRDKWSSRISTILAECYWGIQYIQPFRQGITVGIHFSTPRLFIFHFGYFGHEITVE